MNTYFSSDWHLGHERVIQYDKRPFKNVEIMNNAIIANYNEVVDPGDVFYFLGDFSFEDRRTEEWLSQLNGCKHFMRGNHDKRKTIKLYEKYGTYLGEQKEIEVEGQRITLNHYAMKVWNRSHKGSWHLYGHSHQSLPDDKASLSFDVGLMGWEYKPISFEEVARVMKTKNYKPKDHHGTRAEDKIVQGQ